MKINLVKKGCQQKLEAKVTNKGYFQSKNQTWLMVFEEYSQEKTKGRMDR